MVCALECRLMVTTAPGSNPDPLPSPVVRLRKVCPRKQLTSNLKDVKQKLIERIAKLRNYLDKGSVIFERP